MQLMHESEPTFTEMEVWHKEELHQLRDHPKLKKHRVKGTIAAVEIDNEGEDGYLNPVANRIKEHCVDEGLLLRPLGNVLYLMPPYCTTRQQLAEMYAGINRLLEE